MTLLHLCSVTDEQKVFRAFYADVFSYVKLCADQSTTALEMKLTCQFLCRRSLNGHSTMESSGMVVESVDVTTASCQPR